MRTYRQYFILLLLILGVGFPNTTFGGTNADLTDGFHSQLRIAEIELDLAATDNDTSGAKPPAQPLSNNAAPPLPSTKSSAAPVKVPPPEPSRDQKRLAKIALLKELLQNESRHQLSGGKRTQRDLPENSLAVKLAKKRKKRRHHHGKHRHHLIRRISLRALADAKTRNEYYIGIPLEKLNDSQRKSLRRKLEKLLTKKVIIAFLTAIKRAEGNASLTLPVGGYKSNGLTRKSQSCREQISLLNTSAHPKDQGLPTPCFFYNKNVGQWSFSAGSLQLTYHNWHELQRLFKFEDFKGKNQMVAGLELARSSAVRGSKVGEGFTDLVNGDISGVCLASDPWASSPCSRWAGSKRPILKYAREELKKLDTEQSVNRQINRLIEDKKS